MARLLCMNVKEKYLQPCECKKLDDYYKHLGCECFDITQRQINGKWFDIFCDDVGLFEDHPIPSAFYEKGGKTFVALVGNLIFANHNEAGETTNLSKQDVELIIDNVFATVDGTPIVKLDW